MRALRTGRDASQSGPPDPASRSSAQGARLGGQVPAEQHRGHGPGGHSPPGRGAGGPDLGSFDREELVADFRTACLSRALDDREITLQKQSRVFFQISGAGHEILLTALARSLRPGYDWFFPYYRDRALALALGVSADAMMAQAVGAAADPASGGRQMPCHFGDAGLHIVTQSSPTGSQCLPAVGCAEAARYIVRRAHLEGCSGFGDEVTYVSLGEGATSEGEFWESLNTACRLHLPVLYLVADNGYAISVRAADQAPAPVSELVRGFRGLALTRVDGWDYAGCRTRAGRAVARVRAGEGPGLIHARVTRPYSHSSADAQSKYRSPEDLAAEAAHDPIGVLEQEMVAAGVVTAEEAAAIRAGAAEEAARAAREALELARPDPARVREHLFAEEPHTGGYRTSGYGPSAQPSQRELVHAAPAASPGGSGGSGGDGDGDGDGGQSSGGEPVVMAEAIRMALEELMGDDERIRVFGEDVADAAEALLGQVEGKGGVFGVTRGLQRRFGSARCYNTPLAESNIVGRAVGQALRGLRPCPEIQFFDYIWPAMQQIRSEAATIRWRSNGAFSCPMVLRVAIGGYLTGGAIWHSQCGESIFTHVPGLHIAFASRSADAVGLLRSAFASGDPVLMLEHKHLYRQHYAADPYPAPEWRVPFGSGRTVRPGRDLTVVTWGATVQMSLEAATALALEGIEVEVVDLRSLAPWDQGLVASSLERTSRLLVVHEDTLTSGFGAEVAAWAGEHCFWSLDAPVARLAALDTPVPYAPELERAVLPQAAGIIEAARSLARC